MRRERTENHFITDLDRFGKRDLSGGGLDDLIGEPGEKQQLSKIPGQTHVHQMIRLVDRENRDIIMHGIELIKPQPPRGFVVMKDVNLLNSKLVFSVRGCGTFGGRYSDAAGDWVRH